MRGALVGACNCDWGCPCNFDAPPTQGFCEGAYAHAVREGSFGDVPLAGVRFVTAGTGPGPVHEGNLTSILIMDEGTTPDQRAALERLWRGGGVGNPFDIFASVTSTWLPPMVAPIDVTLDGIRSTFRVGAGRILDLAITRIKNPVTGEEEEIYLDKPTGFTSLRSEMGMTTAFRLTSESLSFEHPGKYAEYAEFEYAGP
jgi:hypothetical protein